MDQADGASQMSKKVGIFLLYLVAALIGVILALGFIWIVSEPIPNTPPFPW